MVINHFRVILKMMPIKKDKRSIRMLVELMYGHLDKCLADKIIGLQTRYKFGINTTQTLDKIFSCSNIFVANN